MEDLIGRKVKGFKFETDLEGVDYNSGMDKHIEEVGVIKRYDKFDETFKVQFKDDYWYYPVSKAVKHLVFEPKRGEEVLVSDGGIFWQKTIFLTEIEGAVNPYFTVEPLHEQEFLNGKFFHVVDWKYMKPIPKKIKITKRQIADKFDIDLNNLEIVD